MRKLSSIPRFVLFVSVLALALTVPTSQAASTGPTPVVVTNLPLPVSVTNTPTVNIGNSASNPALVRDISTLQPAHGFNGCFFSGGSCLIDLVTVPTGMRLVIQHISGNVQTSAADDVVVRAQVGQAYLTCCTVSNDDFLVTQQVSGVGLFQVNHQTLMFFDQGQTVRVQLYKSVANGIGDANFSYAGYFLPL